MDVNLSTLTQAIRNSTTNRETRTAQSRTSRELAASSVSTDDDEESLESHIRRKHTGGLRLKGLSDPKPSKIRRLNAEGKTFPQRRKPHNGDAKMEPSSLDKLVRGIWEQIHGSLSFDLKHVVSKFYLAEFGILFNPVRPF